MGRHAQDPADGDRTYGEDGGLLPEHFTPDERHAMRSPRRRIVPWEEAIEWTFSPMTPPDERTD